MTQPLCVTIHTDGGARGNPGPAAAGVVIRTSDDATVLYEAGYYLGETTNNVAEYSALIEGLKAALKLNASEADVYSDSELMVRQMKGQYRVRNQGLLPLYEEAQALSRKFSRFSVNHVRREQNKVADGLVNRAINVRASVADAAS